MVEDTVIPGGEDDHYEGLASEFEDTWFFDKGYIPWAVEQIVNRLELTQEDHLVDVGGGTGNYTALASQRVGLTNECLVVDLSSEMLGVAQARPELDTLCCGGVEFAQKNDVKPYNKVLFKEVIHHFDAKERSTVFRGVFGQLNEGVAAFRSRDHSTSNGDDESNNVNLFIITRPPRVLFPFFEKALDVFANGQPSHEVLMQELTDAGFLDVKTDIVDYNMSIDKSRWLEMVSKRFMSILNESIFDEAQLKEGVREIEEKYKGTDEIKFPDRLVFITAKVK
eukprot:TRINITY_DN12837_c0_g1_i1.p1 TRINITY_DN12837_c0_g1~~TRINITY_DN12837_c0_g1_i1.p1  ORF type:complete len:281 (-),score=60.44 TRINITY_DN12837_c0_g1_i1:23-865(-)